MDSILTFLLEPVDEGTKVTYRVDCEASGGIFGKAIAKLFAQREVKKGVEKALENLKKTLEK